MNEFSLTQLKIIVERAVRPVRASTLRKRKMREELLAHTCGIFEEEFAQLGNERAALDRTAQRFGKPNELTLQLQESVCASDGIHCLLDKLWFRSGESWGRRILRYGTWYMLILMIFLPAWFAWAQLCAWLVRAVEWPAEEVRLVGGPVLLLDWFFFAFSFLLLLCVLLSGNRAMTARFYSQQEWENLRVDPEGRALE
jgi:hypothetical protein